MIRLTKLELKNFLSHVDTLIDLERYDGLVLIEGITADGHYSSNGAGKSSILEGIVYALTGDTLRGVSVNDVINRNYKKNARVSLSFIKDGISYEVTRYRKDDKLGDALVLVENGKDISKRVNKDTQKLLEDILGISYKVLVSTVLLGEGLSSRFTQLSDPEKKSLVESTLNLNYDIGKIRDKANAKLKDSKLQESNLLGQISVLESRQNIDPTALEDSIKDNEESIKIYKSTIEEINSRYEAVLKEIESITPKKDLISNTLSKYHMLARSYAEMMHNKQHYQDELDRVSSGSTPICSLCRQALQSAESKQSVIDNYQSNIDQISQKMNELELELKNIPDENILQAKLDSLTKDMNEKSAESRALLQDLNSYQVKIAEATKDINMANMELKEVGEYGSQLISVRDQKDRVSKDAMKYDYFYKLFSPTGIIVSILSDAIEYINTRLTIYSEVLLEKDYHINFVKGKISLVDSKGSSYQSLSNGEKRRLDIAIQFSLHDYVHMYCGMKLDCCFIDEILDTLDDIGVENIFDVLRLKIEYCQLKSIYVITHNNSLKSKFDQIITIKKNTNGDSSVV